MVNLPCLMVSRTNFLRPTYSYTECRLSFQTGSCPTEWTTASYSSCLFCFLLTFRFLQRKLFSGRSSLLLPLGLLLFLCGGFLPQPFVLGFSCGTLPDFVFIRNPAGFRLVALTVRFMLPALFLAFSLQYLRAFSQGHKWLPFLGSYKSIAITYRLSKSVTASFSADFRCVSYSIHAALWIPRRDRLPTLLLEIASTAAVCVLYGWSSSVLDACRSCTPPGSSCRRSSGNGPACRSSRQNVPSTFPKASLYSGK